MCNVVTSPFGTSWYDVVGIVVIILTLLDGNSMEVKLRMSTALKLDGVNLDISSFDLRNNPPLVKIPASFNSFFVPMRT